MNSISNCFQNYFEYKILKKIKKKNKEKNFEAIYSIFENVSLAIKAYPTCNILSNCRLTLNYTVPMNKQHVIDILFDNLKVVLNKVATSQHGIKLICLPILENNNKRPVSFLLKFNENNEIVYIICVDKYKASQSYRERYNDVQFTFSSITFWSSTKQNATSISFWFYIVLIGLVEQSDSSRILYTVLLPMIGKKIYIEKPIQLLSNEEDIEYYSSNWEVCLNTLVSIQLLLNIQNETDINIETKLTSQLLDVINDINVSIIDEFSSLPNIIMKESINDNINFFGIYNFITLYSRYVLIQHTLYNGLFLPSFEKLMKIYVEISKCLEYTLINKKVNNHISVSLQFHNIGYLRNYNFICSGSTINCSSIATRIDFTKPNADLEHILNCLRLLEYQKVKNKIWHQLIIVDNYVKIHINTIVNSQLYSNTIVSQKYVCSSVFELSKYVISIIFNITKSMTSKRTFISAIRIVKAFSNCILLLVKLFLIYDKLLRLQPVDYTNLLGLVYNGKDSITNNPDEQLGFHINFHGVLDIIENLIVDDANEINILTQFRSYILNASKYKTQEILIFDVYGVKLGYNDILLLLQAGKLYGLSESYIMSNIVMQNTVISKSAILSLPSSSYYNNFASNINQYFELRDLVFYLKLSLGIYHKLIYAISNYEELNVLTYLQNSSPNLYRPLIKYKSIDANLVVYNIKFFGISSKAIDKLLITKSSNVLINTALTITDIFSLSENIIDNTYEQQLKNEVKRLFKNNSSIKLIAKTELSDDNNSTKNNATNIKVNESINNLYKMSYQAENSGENNQLTISKYIYEGSKLIMGIFDQFNQNDSYFNIDSVGNCVNSCFSASLLQDFRKMNLGVQDDEKKIGFYDVNGNLVSIEYALPIYGKAINKLMLNSIQIYTVDLLNSKYVPKLVHNMSFKQAMQISQTIENPLLRINTFTLFLLKNPELLSNTVMQELYYYSIFHTGYFNINKNLLANFNILKLKLPFSYSNLSIKTKIHYRAVCGTSSGYLEYEILNNCSNFTKNLVSLALKCCDLDNNDRSPNTNNGLHGLGYITSIICKIYHCYTNIINNIKEIQEKKDDISNNSIYVHYSNYTEYLQCYIHCRAELYNLLVYDIASFSKNYRIKWCNTTNYNHSFIEELDCNIFSIKVLNHIENGISYDAIKMTDHNIIFVEDGDAEVNMHEAEQTATPVENIFRTNAYLDLVAYGQSIFYILMQRNIDNEDSSDSKFVLSWASDDEDAIKTTTTETNHTNYNLDDCNYEIWSMSNRDLFQHLSLFRHYIVPLAEMNIKLRNKVCNEIVKRVCTVKEDNHSNTYSAQVAQWNISTEAFIGSLYKFTNKNIGRYSKETQNSSIVVDLQVGEISFAEKKLTAAENWIYRLPEYNEVIVHELNNNQTSKTFYVEIDNNDFFEHYKLVGPSSEFDLYRIKPYNGILISGNRLDNYLAYRYNRKLDIQKILKADDMKKSANIAKTSQGYGLASALARTLTGQTVSSSSQKTKKKLEIELKELCNTAPYSELISKAAITSSNLQLWDTNKFKNFMLWKANSKYKSTPFYVAPYYRDNNDYYVVIAIIAEMQKKNHNELPAINSLLYSQQIHEIIYNSHNNLVEVFVYCNQGFGICKSCIYTSNVKLAYSNICFANSNIESNSNYFINDLLEKKYISSLRVTKTLNNYEANNENFAYNDYENIILGTSINSNNGLSWSSILYKTYNCLIQILSNTSNPLLKALKDIFLWAKTQTNMQRIHIKSNYLSGLIPQYLVENTILWRTISPLYLVLSIYEAYAENNITSTLRLSSLSHDVLRHCLQSRQFATLIANLMQPVTIINSNSIIIYIIPQLHELSICDWKQSEITLKDVWFNKNPYNIYIEDLLNNSVGYIQINRNAQILTLINIQQTMTEKTELISQLLLLDDLCNIMAYTKEFPNLQIILSNYYEELHKNLEGIANNYNTNDFETIKCNFCHYYYYLYKKFLSALNSTMDNHLDNRITHIDYIDLPRLNLQFTLIDGYYYSSEFPDYFIVNNAANINEYVVKCAGSLLKHALVLVNNFGSYLFVLNIAKVLTIYASKNKIDHKLNEKNYKEKVNLNYCCTFEVHVANLFLAARNPEDLLLLFAYRLYSCEYDHCLQIVKNSAFFELCQSNDYRNIDKYAWNAMNDCFIDYDHYSSDGIGIRLKFYIHCNLINMNDKVKKLVKWNLAELYDCYCRQYYYIAEKYKLTMSDERKILNIIGKYAKGKYIYITRRANILNCLEDSNPYILHLSDKYKMSICAFDHVKTKDASVNSMSTILSEFINTISSYMQSYTNLTNLNNKEMIKFIINILFPYDINLAEAKTPLNYSSISLGKNFIIIYELLTENIKVNLLNNNSTIPWGILLARLVHSNELCNANRYSGILKCLVVNPEFARTVAPKYVAMNVQSKKSNAQEEKNNPLFINPNKNKTWEILLYEAFSKPAQIFEQTEEILKPPASCSIDKLELYKNDLTLYFNLPPEQITLDPIIKTAKIYSIFFATNFDQKIIDMMISSPSINGNSDKICNYFTTPLIYLQDFFDLKKEEKKINEAKIFFKNIKNNKFIEIISQKGVEEIIDNYIMPDPVLLNKQLKKVLNELQIYEKHEIKIYDHLLNVLVQTLLRTMNTKLHSNNLDYHKMLKLTGLQDMQEFVFLFNALLYANAENVYIQMLNTDLPTSKIIIWYVIFICFSINRRMLIVEAIKIINNLFSCYRKKEEEPNGRNTSTAVQLKTQLFQDFDTISASVFYEQLIGLIQYKFDYIHPVNTDELCLHCYKKDHFDATDTENALNYRTSATHYFLCFDIYKLMFEFANRIKLRNNQSSLINDIYKCLANKQPLCTQLMMGEGKTTIINPLISLISANMNKLVFCVVPQHLLKFTKSAMESRFNFIFHKPITILNFDRYDNVSEKLLALLLRIKNQKGIIIVPPNTLKALFLKFTLLYFAYKKCDRILDDIKNTETIDTAFVNAQNRARSALTNAYKNIRNYKVNRPLSNYKGTIKATYNNIAKFYNEQNISTGEFLTDVKQAVLNKLKTKDTQRHAKLEKKDEKEKLKNLPKCKKQLELLVKILRIFQNDSFIILDEVDQLLHPLKSELRWPIGKSTSVDFCLGDNNIANNKDYIQYKVKSLKGCRWTIAWHFFELLYRDSNNSSCICYNILLNNDYDLDQCSRIRQKFIETKMLLLENNMIANTKQFILLDMTIYKETLLPILAEWFIIYARKLNLLNEHNNYKENNTDCYTVIEQLLIQILTNKKPLSIIEEKCFGKTANDDSHFKYLSCQQSINHIKLVYNWLNNFGPYILIKVYKIHFGLLTTSNEINFNYNHPDTSIDESLVRKFLAVPYIAKDRPTKNSEFANIDVLIGLTITSYIVHGLCSNNILICIKDLQSLRKQEYNIDKKTSAALNLFRSWVNESGGKIKGELDEAYNNYIGLRSKDSYTNTQYKSIVQLELIDFSNKHICNDLVTLLKFNTNTIHYLLCTILFPNILKISKYSIISSGQEFGSNILFKSKVGFSGTPNSLLPIEFGECKYQIGCDYKMLNTLLDSNICDVHIIKKNCSTDTTKKFTVTDQTIISAINNNCNCLIDTGGLLIDKTNKNVAYYILENKNWHKDISKVLYFEDTTDKKLLLHRNEILLTINNIVYVEEENLTQTFVYYDQIHSYGQDIRLSGKCKGAITINKDTNFRDLAQGAWRLRKLAKGQTLMYIVQEELLDIMLKAPKVIYTTNKYMNTTMLEIINWTLINSINLELNLSILNYKQTLHNLLKSVELTHIHEEESTIDDINLDPDLFIVDEIDINDKILLNKANQVLKLNTVNLEKKKLINVVLNSYLNKLEYHKNLLQCNSTIIDTRVFTDELTSLIFNFKLKSVDNYNQDAEIEVEQEVEIEQEEMLELEQQVEKQMVNNKKLTTYSWSKYKPAINYYLIQDLLCESIQLNNYTFICKSLKASNVTYKYNLPVSSSLKVSKNVLPSSDNSSVLGEVLYQLTIELLPGHKLYKNDNITAEDRENLNKIFSCFNNSSNISIVSAMNIFGFTDAAIGNMSAYLNNIMNFSDYKPIIDFNTKKNGIADASVNYKNNSDCCYTKDKLYSLLTTTYSLCSSLPGFTMLVNSQNVYDILITIEEAQYIRGLLNLVPYNHFSDVYRFKLKLKCTYDNYQYLDYMHKSYHDRAINKVFLMYINSLAIKMRIEEINIFNCNFSFNYDSLRFTHKFMIQLVNSIFVKNKYAFIAHSNKFIKNLHDKIIDENETDLFEWVKLFLFRYNKKYYEIDSFVSNQLSNTSLSLCLQFDYNFNYNFNIQNITSILKESGITPTILAPILMLDDNRVMYWNLYCIIAKNTFHFMDLSAIANILGKLKTAVRPIDSKISVIDDIFT